MVLLCSIMRIVLRVTFSNTQTLKNFPDFWWGKVFGKPSISWLVLTLILNKSSQPSKLFSHINFFFLRLRVCQNVTFPTPIQLFCGGRRHDGMMGFTQSTLRVKVGDLVLNWRNFFFSSRVLHARTSFTGSRTLAGCYVDMDEYTSKLRVLREKYEK